MRGYSKTGSIMSLATKDVVTISPTSTIKAAVELMVRKGFRRLPVTDSGTGRLQGVLGSSDIVDLIGGDKKYQFITKAHRGNFLSAINDSVRRIMNTEVLIIDKSASGREGLELLLSKNRGGLVVVDREHLIQGIITERDFLGVALSQAEDKKVSDFMTPNVIYATPGTTLGDAAKMMIRNSFRRLPILSEDKLVGMVTTRTLLNFVGENSVFKKMVKNDVKEILKTRLSEVMSHKTAIVERTADLKTAIQLMITTREGTVCVIEKGELGGILTERDVVKSIGG